MDDDIYSAAGDKQKEMESTTRYDADNGILDDAIVISGCFSALCVPNNGSNANFAKNMYGLLY